MFGGSGLMQFVFCPSVTKDAHIVPRQCIQPGRHASMVNAGRLSMFV